MAHATGVDHAVNQAVEETIVRALRSPTVIRAIERAIETDAAGGERGSDEIAQAVRRVLQSDAAGQAWADFLESEQMQTLVERIASAPELRAAIAAQGAGLITDIGVRLTHLTEGLDDALERIVRPHDPDSEMNQAGLATRLVAAGIDVGMLILAYSLISNPVAAVIAAVFGDHPSLVAIVVLGVLGLIVAGGVFAAFWTLAGQTPGMRFLSIRLTYQGSRHVPFGCAARRVGAVILSLIPLGLGFLAILRDPSRRAWHDRLTGTEVVYDKAERSNSRRQRAAAATTQ